MRILTIPTHIVLLATIRYFFCSAAFQPARNTNHRHQHDSTPHSPLPCLNAFPEHLASSAEDHLRKLSQTHCTCSAPLLQSRFCNQHFVFVGKRTLNAETRTFHAIPGAPHIAWPYSGKVIPVTVQHGVKGPLRANQSVELYFVQGTGCGIAPNNPLPLETDESYLLSGFQLKIPNCDKSNPPRCSQPVELFVITRCGWSQPITQLTSSQIAGVFLGLYSCKEGSCRDLRPMFWKRSPVPSPTACNYHFSTRQCYSRFAVCTRTSSKKCTLRAVNRIPKTAKVLARIPTELHPLIMQSASSIVTDEMKFRACILHFDVS